MILNMNLLLFLRKMRYCLCLTLLLTIFIGACVRTDPYEQEVKKQNESDTLKVGKSSENSEDLELILENNFSEFQKENKTNYPSAQSSSNITISQASKQEIQENEALLKFSNENLQVAELKIIVPTYIPEDFTLEKLEIGRGQYPSYSLAYKNHKVDSCFQISARSDGFGAGEDKYEELEVFSPALGVITLAILSFSRETDTPLIRLKDHHFMRNNRGYSVNFGYGCDKSLNLKEAVKVVESLQYLKSLDTSKISLDDIQEKSKFLISKYDFPMDSCGERTKRISQKWYPVFLDGSSLYSGKGYCKDAISIEKNNVEFGYEFEKIQLASFSSYEQAKEFATAVGGRVGQPNQ